MMIRNIVIAVLVASFVLVGLMGCDAQKAGSERMAREVRVPKEDLQKFGQMIEEQRQEILKYFNEYGILPSSLDELKQTGYKVLEPYRKHRWEYKVFQLRERNGFTITMVPAMPNASP